MALKHRGVMVDLARERSFHLRWTIDLIRDLPRQGSNELHLYLENRFAFPSLAGAYPKGSLKPAQVRVLEHEAAKVGIALIPHLNLLGHNENLLRRREFRQLRAEAEPGRAYQLNPLHPKTRPLLEKMIGDVCRTFSSAVIHVGCDEADEWKRLERRSGKKSWEIFADHVVWIHRELTRHGRRTAIWADMLLRHPQLLRTLPDDLLLFDWCYAGRRPESLRALEHGGFEVIAATSPVGCFSFLPHPPSVGRQLAFLDDAFELGATGHLATLWELMRGYPFSIEYAWSLPAQWKAAGLTGTADTLWKRFYRKAGLAWWKAAERLSRLQFDDGLLLRKPSREWVFNLDASQALTAATHPFALELKYSGRVNVQKMRARLAKIEAWRRAAGRLPRFAPRGPLRILAADLRLTADRMAWTLARFLEWEDSDKGAADLPGLLAPREKIRRALLGEYRKRAAGEGYGTATIERLSESIRNLARARKSRIRGKIRLSSFAGTGPEDYSIRRAVHPVDLA